MNQPDTTNNTEPPKQDTNDNFDLRQLLEKIFIIDDDTYLEYTDAGVYIKPEAIAEIKAYFESDSHQREQEAYKKGYIDGGIAEITK